MAIIWLRFKGYIIVAAGAVLSVLAIYLAGRKQGYDSAENDMREADNAQARKIEDLADRVRHADGDNRTAVERLRVAKRLRDL
jgi:uncharacterized membrane protein YdjX (TVP38/TMEM64 family)